ncbi:serine hydroxymethyltransferase [Thermoplasma volcanium]|nr:serine hydroxymethyltransferase [Thermoplasma volcanium]
MRKILSIVQDADIYRSSVINLQASENVISPNVRRALASDFASRYSHKENGVNDYGGTKYAEELEESVNELASEVFNFKYADAKPLSGHVAAETVLAALVKRGESIMKIPERNGGYQGYLNGYLPSLMGFRSYDIPMKPDQAIDFESFEKTIDYIRPKVVILGQSVFVKSYDIPKVRELCNSVGSMLLYDASHVMGLIAGGTFQKDIGLCDVVFGSTHKTFFGPQGGIILTNEAEVFDRIEKKITWITMDNFNISRMAGVGVALEETKKFGREYASRVVKNAKDLAKELDGKLPIKYSPWFTESHQVLIDEEGLKKDGYDTIKFSEDLEKNGIIVDRIGRIGTAEITRMGVDDVQPIADMIKDAYIGKDVKERVNKFVSNMKMRYYES